MRFEGLPEKGAPARLGVHGCRFATIFLIFLAVQWLPALEPPGPGDLQRFRNDGSLAARLARAKDLGNHQVDPWLAFQYRQKMNRLLSPRQAGMGGQEQFEVELPPARRKMPTTGTVRILTLLIQFPEYPAVSSRDYVVQRLFGTSTEGIPLDTLRNFYFRSSYGLLTIQGDVLGWYQPAYSRQSVPETAAGREALIMEALNYYDARGHDFSQYDNDGDGEIDYLAVIWTGPHQNWADFWWGYQTSFRSMSPVLDGARVSQYSWQWENRNWPALFAPGVVIHETGHALGLPDYYDYDAQIGPRGGVGGMDMMDGSWGDHNAFSKFLLDWLEPQVANSGRTGVVLHPSHTLPEALIVMPEVATGEALSEYFLVQNRQAGGNDQTLPGSGLMIWHVDARLDDFMWEFAYDNSYSSHKLLRLMEADGLEEIETGDRRGDFGDYYLAGRIFGPSTVPSSTRYDGSATGMSVQNIQNVTFGVRFDVTSQYNDLTPPAGLPAPPESAVNPAVLPEITFSWGMGTCSEPDSPVIAGNLEIRRCRDQAILFAGRIGNSWSKRFRGAQDGEAYQARVQLINACGLTGAWSEWGEEIRVDLLPLGPALDNYELDFQTGATYGWYAQRDIHYFPGPEAARSGYLPNRASSRLESQVTGPAQVSFCWKVSSEADCDLLEFLLDGEEIATISGERDWSRFTLAVPAGVHSLAWNYGKDGSVAGGSDAGWLDQVRIFVPQAGDLDLAGDWTVLDLLALSRYLAGGLQPGQAPFLAGLPAADLDGSGTVNATDLLLLKWLLTEDASAPAS